jgi:hypothetical protein
MTNFKQTKHTQTTLAVITTTFIVIDLFMFYSQIRLANSRNSITLKQSQFTLEEDVNN